MMRAVGPAGVLLLGLLTTGAALGQAPPPPAGPPPVPAAPSPAPPPPASPPGGGWTQPPNAGNPPAPPAPETPPGYYVEQGQAPPQPPGPASGQPPGPPQYYEPPPPPPPVGVVFEPPPPPVPRHLAPRTALWLGVRTGWFWPFGSAYAHGVADPYGNIYLTSVSWTRFLSSGPALELNAGVRLGRYYNLFGIWQHSWLLSGDGYRHAYGGQNGGDTDFFAVGLRASSNADGIGLTTELALGYRQARAKWEDGTELRMTGGVLEGRLGIGADLRLSKVFSLGPLFELGIGSFDRVRYVSSSGASYDVIGPYDAPGSHGWLMLGIGGFVDLFGSDD